MQSKIPKLKFISVVLGMLLAPAGIANAATLSVYKELDLQTTNFSDTLSIQKFDSSLGILKSIKFEVTGLVNGDVEFESRDNASSTVTAQLSSLLKFLRPDNNSILAEVKPLVSVTDTLTSYDQKLDFAGGSGRTYNGLSGTATQTIKIDAPSESDLALFTGSQGSTIDFAVNAEATSEMKGSGNIVSAFATLAKAGVNVEYEYEAPKRQEIPEPSTAIGASVAMALGLLRQRKKLHKEV